MRQVRAGLPAAYPDPGRTGEGGGKTGAVGEAKGKQAPGSSGFREFAVYGEAVIIWGNLEEFIIKMVIFIGKCGILI